MELVCRACDGHNDFSRNWIEDTDKCKFCGTAGMWRRPDEPKVLFHLSLNDKLFLRSIRVDPE
jgi:hypothetical protein